MLRYIPVYLSTLTLFLSSVLSGPTPPPHQIQSYAGETTGLYIVTLKEGVSRTAVIDQLTTVGQDAVDVVHEYENVFNGFAGELDDPALALLRTLTDVVSIAEDGVLHVTATVERTDEPWGLARLSAGPQPWLKDQDPSQLTYKYRYDDTAGEGVDIYIVDTGIRINHTDFGGRARWGKTFGECYVDKDGNGHGTHVAGTAAGSRYGVAKSASIVAVKVLDDDGSGNTSDIIAGLDWVIGQYTATRRPSVVNLSLGGPVNSALDSATKRLIANGIHVVVAAGNNNVDAADVSPAHVDEVITVAASTINDERAWFSNFGQVVDLFAPGQYVTSSWIKTSEDVNSISGTSMATPHVTGLVAYLIALEGNILPEAMKTRLQNLGKKDVLSDIPTGTKNVLIHNILEKDASALPIGSKA